VNEWHYCSHKKENEKITSNTFIFSFIKIISHGPFPNYSGYMARSVYVPLKAFNTPFDLKKKN